MKRFTALLTLALVLMVGKVQAQYGFSTNTTASATARVLTALTVSTAQNLSFGDLFNGTNKTVAPSSSGASAAAFFTANTSQLPFMATWTLPSSLSDGSGHNLTVTNWLVRDCNTVNGDADCPTTYDPTSPKSFPAGLSNVYFWLGATATATPSQAAANYSATITLTISY